MASEKLFSSAPAELTDLGPGDYESCNVDDIYSNYKKGTHYIEKQERFGKDHTIAPGPGAYENVNLSASQKKTLGTAPFLSKQPKLLQTKPAAPDVVVKGPEWVKKTSPRKNLDFGRENRFKSSNTLAPPPGAYNNTKDTKSPRSFKKKKRAASGYINSAEFSTTPRFYSPKNQAPAPGSYDTGLKKTKPRRQISTLGSSKRFKDPTRGIGTSQHIGPGSYNVNNRVLANRTRSTTSVFKSSTPRFNYFKINRRR
ncbi:hypothetical protein PCE1_000772 [Barthelona sp. PCE]